MALIPEMPLNKSVLLVAGRLIGLSNDLKERGLSSSAETVLDAVSLMNQMLNLHKGLVEREERLTAEIGPLRDRYGDPLAQALSSSDLDKTLRILQAALGITTGDVAGVCFSAKDRETYAALAPNLRPSFILSWLSLEMVYATERAAR